MWKFSVWLSERNNHGYDWNTTNAHLNFVTLKPKQDGSSEYRCQHASHSCPFRSSWRALEIRNGRQVHSNPGTTGLLGNQWTSSSSPIKVTSYCSTLLELPEKERGCNKTIWLKTPKFHPRIMKKKKVNEARLYSVVDRWPEKTLEAMHVGESGFDLLYRMWVCEASYPSATDQGSV